MPFPPAPAVDIHGDSDEHSKQEGWALVDDIERGRTERLRTETGDRVWLTRYRGQSHLDADRSVPVAGLLGVWTHDSGFRLAGGWFSEQSHSGLLDGAPETDPNGCRNELIDLVRGTR